MRYRSGFLREQAGAVCPAACEMTTLLEYDLRMLERSDPEPTPAVGDRLELEFIDPLAGPRWDALALSHPQASIFHSTAWARVLAKTYAHNPLYFRLASGNTLQALIPLMELKSRITGRRGICLPFSDGCGPLYFGETWPGVIAERLAGIAVERQWDYFELRDQFSPTPSIQFYGHRLDLRSGPEALLAGCSSAARRAIRKAEKSGLVAEISQSWEALLDFYELHVRTRRRHGLPPQPLGFFRNIFSEIIQPGRGFVVRAMLDPRCLAAATFFRFGRTAIYKFGASAPAWHQLRGNNLVIWAGIRRLIEEGCEVLSFGRTSLCNQSLRRFKLSWGSEEEMISYCKWNTATSKWTTSRDHSSGWHDALFSRLPLSVNRVAGAMLYPHLD